MSETYVWNARATSRSLFPSLPDLLAGTSNMGGPKLCLVLRTGWAACGTTSGTTSGRRPSAGTLARGNRTAVPNLQSNTKAVRQPSRQAAPLAHPSQAIRLLPARCRPFRTDWKFVGKAQPEAQAAHPASRADHRTQTDRSRTGKECQEMLGPETSQARKAAAGTRTHGLPHAERVLYQLSQVDPDHAVKGPHTDTQKPPKTKALAKKRSRLKRRPPEPRGTWPQRSRPDTAWAILFFELPETSSQAAAAAHPGCQTVRVSNYRRQICCAVCSARWSVQGHKDWCLVLRTGWAACGTTSRRRPGAGTLAHGNRQRHNAEQTSILAKNQKHKFSFSRFKISSCLRFGWKVACVNVPPKSGNFGNFRRKNR